MFARVVKQNFRGTPLILQQSRMINTEMLSASYQHLELRQGAKQSLWVQLNRPDLHNAFNPVVISELSQVFSSLADDCDDVRSVVLAGNGKSFCAGADLNWMQGMVSHTFDENKADSKKLFNMFASIKNCPVPVIARVHGAAIAGGTGLVAACDIAFSVNAAKYGLTEAKIGLVPAVISKCVMDKIGQNNCRRYFYTAELFSATEALRMGLVHDTVETVEELDELVASTVKAIGNNSPKAVRKCKELIDTVAAMPNMESTVDYTCETIAGIRVSEEGQEGLKSFLEKRKPGWLTQ